MKRIAFLVQDLDSDYFNYMVDGVRKFCNENDYELVVYIIRGKNWKHGNFDYQYYAVIKLCTTYNIDGVILASNTFLQYVDQDKWAGILSHFNKIPFVSIGVSCPGVTSVVSENKTALRQILDHLYNEHGRCRFALLVPDLPSLDILARREAFVEFAREKGDALENARIITTEDYTYEEAYQVMMKTCVSGEIDFDALITCSDDLAFGSMAALRTYGISIPEDISVTGFDNQRRCEYSDPPLTSIDQQLNLQGYEAAKIVASKIEGNFNGRDANYVSSVPVYRKSCGCSNFVTERLTLSDELMVLNRKDILINFHFFLQAMQASLSHEEYKTLFIKSLKQYGIKSCVVCLYDEPVLFKINQNFNVPKKAKILIAYNEYEYCKELESKVLCPEKEMVPADFKWVKGKEIVVSSLFNTNYQYGYIVYNPGDMESRMYELIFSAAGIALASNRLINLKDLERDTDAMTGVYNRGGFMERGQILINSAVTKGLKGMVVFGDMDHLKKINDELGHDAGDEAIKAEVTLLRSVFRESDIVGRLGGDEFAIVCPGLKEERFKVIKENLKAASEEFNQSSGKPYQVSISLGATAFEEGNSDLGELLKLADSLQYEEKRRRHAARD